MITSPSRPQGLELKTEPITKLSEVHIALKALGAKTLDDYALEAVATSRDRFESGNQGQLSAPMASDDYLNDLDALALSSPRLTPSKRPRDGEQDADDNAEEAAPLLSTSSTGPLSLLPITVHSKLAKKMASSRTGSIHESFKREPGKTAVSTLNEFAQQAALRAPEYAHTSQEGWVAKRSRSV
ncbi:hypothetical protein BDZ90DRAFT_232401 [Jaminaea rosea]|uniref:Uncharacterized protein n=1 Tax=Jaminaea rosea TaxID=1569628 RepID=A0A316USW8_9BASI|nr:hypothetical protein BDZ90DRAFT_232401 [Jaminaea rosea]PWN27431.1 hypothetical protein BDZ90DRAFT_232401 [Jaminaea rosea]